MRIALVAAVARNGVIGVDNRLPWRLPEDLQHFKRLTMGKPLIMGRRTFESIGRPLPGRRNIVVTRQADWSRPGVEVVHSLDEALRRCAGTDEVMVIGGAQIYAEALPRATDLHLTLVDCAPEGDAYFPDFDRRAWKLRASASCGGATSGIPFRREHWSR